MIVWLDICYWRYCRSMQHIWVTTLCILFADDVLLASSETGLCWREISLGMAEGPHKQMDRQMDEQVGRWMDGKCILSSSWRSNFPQMYDLFFRGINLHMVSIPEVTFGLQ